MPRRKRLRKNEATWLIILIIGLALLGKRSFASDGVWVVMAVIIGLAAFLFILNRALDRRRIDNAVAVAIGRHQATLIRRRAQLLTEDAFGSVDESKWMKEVSHFINTQVASSLSERQRRQISRRRNQVADRINMRIVAAAARQPDTYSLPPDPTPVEFEKYCAEVLRRVGWIARVTKASGDQGVDVIASRNNVRVALQCKLYSHPVGNKAVQEIAAGRLHEGADFAVVVSNKSFTVAAQQLAKTMGVMLIHHSQLGELDKLLGGSG